MAEVLAFQSPKNQSQSNLVARVMHQVTLQEAQTHLSALFESVLHGEEVVVTDRETPVLRMLPLSRPQTHPTFGSAKGKIRMAADFNEMPPEFEDYL